MSKLRLAPLITVAAAALTVGATFPLSFARADDTKPADNTKPYVIQNGRVDKHVFNGYRRYGDNCLRCHGPNATGSSYAPDLTDSLKHMTKEQVEEVIINGRKNVNTANENVMPALGTNPDVVENIDDIYAYLKARSDGALGPGRPKQIGDNDD